MELVQDNAELPEPPVTLVEDSTQDRFGEFVVTARVAVPVNPFRELIVIVAFPGTPVFVFRAVGFADMVKSGGGVI